MPEGRDEDLQAEDDSTVIADLAEQVKRFHERTERHEEIIRQMQGRITELQGDQVQALLKPALVRFAGLHAQASAAETEAVERGEQAARDFAFFRTAIEDALALIDLDSVGAVPGAPFDAVRHHATGVVTTADPALDQIIERVVRQGFAYTDAPRTTIPAQVEIFRFVAPPTDVSPTQDPDTSEPATSEGEQQ